MLFAIYDVPNAEYCAHDYFLKPTQSQDGPTRRCIAPVLASQLALCSFAVAKVSHRAAHTGLHWQGATRHSRGKRYRRKWYVVSHIDYCVVSIAWADNAVTEHSTHATRADAIAACRAAHAKAGH